MSLFWPLGFVDDAMWTGNSHDLDVAWVRTPARVSATALASDALICLAARRAKSLVENPDVKSSVPSGLWHEMHAVLSGRSCVRADRAAVFEEDWVTAGGCPDAPSIGTNNSAKARRLVTAKHIDRRVVYRIALAIRADDRARIRLTHTSRQRQLLREGVRHEVPAECLAILAVH